MRGPARARLTNRKALFNDLLETRQTTGTNDELLRKFTYNSLHQPLTDTDAARQVMTYTYNAQGQILTRKNAEGYRGQSTYLDIMA